MAGSFTPFHSERAVDILVKTNFDEDRVLRLLGWLAHENALILRGNASLPLLYDSNIVYAPERGEVFSDVTHTLLAGQEDCDALAAYRAGELVARGSAALFRGEPGFGVARKRRLRTIHAEPMLTTRTSPGERGLFHCIVRYRIGKRWYRDDPSERLGMNGRFDPAVLGRRAGIRQSLQSRSRHAPRTR